MRRAAHTDANQTAIVNALRAHGITAHVTSGLGKGFPDVVAGFRGINVLLEVKNASADRGNPTRLTGDEQQFHDLWGGQVSVVDSPEQAVLAVIEHVKGLGRLPSFVAPE